MNRAARRRSTLPMSLMDSRWLDLITDRAPRPEHDRGATERPDLTEALRPLRPFTRLLIRPFTRLWIRNPKALPHPSVPRASGYAPIKSAEAVIVSDRYTGDEVESGSPALAAAPAAATEANQTSLYNTGLPFDTCVRHGRCFTEVIVAEDHRLALMSVQQMKCILFWFYHTYKNTGGLRESHTSLTHYISSRMLPGYTNSMRVRGSKK